MWIGSFVHIYGHLGENNVKKELSTFHSVVVRNCRFNKILVDKSCYWNISLEVNFSSAPAAHVTVHRSVNDRNSGEFHVSILHVAFLTTASLWHLSHCDVPPTVDGGFRVHKTLV